MRKHFAVIQKLWGIQIFIFYVRNNIKGKFNMPFIVLHVGRSSMFKCTVFLMIHDCIFGRRANVHGILYYCQTVWSSLLWFKVISFILDQCTAYRSILPVNCCSLILIWGFCGLWLTVRIQVKLVSFSAIGSKLTKFIHWGTYT